MKCVSDPFLLLLVLTIKMCVCVKEQLCILAIALRANIGFVPAVVVVLDQLEVNVQLHAAESAVMESCVRKSPFSLTFVLLIQVFLEPLHALEVLLAQEAHWLLFILMVTEHMHVEVNQAVKLHLTGQALNNVLP